VGFIAGLDVLEMREIYCPGGISEIRDCLLPFGTEFPSRIVLLFIFSGSAAQRWLWPPLALQPNAGYGLLWHCSPARALASYGSAAKRELWPPLTL
jgi:hypothetical protein